MYVIVVVLEASFAVSPVPSPVSLPFPSKENAGDKLPFGNDLGFLTGL